jgi:hypothetical protein
VEDIKGSLVEKKRIGITYFIPRRAVRSKVVSLLRLTSFGAPSLPTLSTAIAAIFHRLNLSSARPHESHRSHKTSTALVGVFTNKQ